MYGITEYRCVIKTIELCATFCASTKIVTNSEADMETCDTSTKNHGFVY